MIAGVSFLDNASASMRKMLNEGSGFFAYMFVVFSCLMAAGVAYSAARVTFAEQERDLATLRVLGFSRREVSYVLLAEIGALLLVALPAGAVARYVAVALADGAVPDRAVHLSVHHTGLGLWPLCTVRRGCGHRRGTGGAARRGSPGPGRCAQVERIRMPNEELQRRSRRVRIFWIVAAAAVVIAIAVSMLPDAVEADLAKADRGDVRVEVVDEGKTRMHDIYVISAPVTGRVLRVEVEPGDEVQAGTIVARMSRAAAGFLDTRSDLAGAGGGQCCRGAVALCRGRSGAGRARASSQHRARRGEPDFQGGGGSERSATRRGACGPRCGQGRGRARAQRIDWIHPGRRAAS